MKRVLITGSSRGIGRAIAEELARLGFQVTLHARTRSVALAQAEEAIVACGQSQVQSLLFDVADRASAAQVLSQEIEAHGAFYGVVCAAGISADAAFPAMSDEQWDSVLATNLDGFYNVLRPLVLPMIQLRSGGRIVCLSSVSGLSGNRGQVNYSASKAALIGACKALARELAKRRISVNCIAPGPVATEMISPELAEALCAQIPMQRLAKVEEVAAAAGFLFDPRAEYISGHTLVMSGGLL